MIFFNVVIFAYPRRKNRQTATAAFSLVRFDSKIEIFSTGEYLYQYFSLTYLFIKNNFQFKFGNTARDGCDCFTFCYCQTWDYNRESEESNFLEFWHFWNEWFLIKLKIKLFCAYEIVIFSFNSLNYFFYFSFK